MSALADPPASAVMIYVLFGWFEHTLKVAVAISRNTHDLVTIIAPAIPLSVETEGL